MIFTIAWKDLTTDADFFRETHCRSDMPKYKAVPSDICILFADLINGNFDEW